MSNRVYVVETKSKRARKWSPRWSSHLLNSAKARARDLAYQYTDDCWRVVPYELTSKRALLTIYPVDKR